MSEEFRTTLWENIRGRIVYLKENSKRLGEGVEIAQVLTEELERIYTEIEKLTKRVCNLEDKYNEVN